jgi:hypothetical protein
MSENMDNTMEAVNFRRFLSYLYAYEDDVKLRNVGFVKVEVRPPRVRFQITVNGILQKGGRPLEVCLVNKNQQKVPVGQLSLQNGRGEYRNTGSMENLWGSGWTFPQVYGICLQGAGDKRHYYMTLWKEFPGQPEEQRGAEKTGEIGEIQLEDDTAEIQEIPLEEDTGEMQAEDSMTEIQAESVETLSAENVSETNQLKRNMEQNGDKCMELWIKFCSRYPHVDIRPMESGLSESNSDLDLLDLMGEICEAIRIRPNDIGRLPRNNWILAQNSFLQNSYNRYRQLVLFRAEKSNLNSQVENRWFIGLPGEYSEQEKQVAEVFGFQNYLTCRNGGFWYTEVMMG